MCSHTLVPVLISHLLISDTVIYMVMLNDPSHPLLFHLSLSLSLPHTMWKLKQRASTGGGQIRLFKWIGHYSGAAWGYRWEYNHAISSSIAAQQSSLPSLFSSCLLESIFSHLKATASPLGSKKKKGGKIYPVPKSFPWKSLWLQCAHSARLTTARAECLTYQPKCMTRGGIIKKRCLGKMSKWVLRERRKVIRIPLVAQFL